MRLTLSLIFLLVAVPASLSRHHEPHYIISPAQEHRSHQRAASASPECAQWMAGLANLRAFVADGSYNTDLWMYVNMFKYLTTPGVYVECGANHARDGSTSYFFDRCLGWHGLCVEPQSKYAAGYGTHNRTCTLTPECVSNRTEIVDFHEADGLGGFDVPVKKQQLHGTHNYAATSQRQCTTAASLLSRHNVTHIHLLILDMEGGELKFLQGLNWDAVTIDIILVETTRYSHRDLIQSKGYSLLPLDFFPWDEMYVRHGLHFPISNWTLTHEAGRGPGDSTTSVHRGMIVRIETVLF